jgi:hypothetical protein
LWSGFLIYISISGTILKHAAPSSSKLDLSNFHLRHDSNNHPNIVVETHQEIKSDADQLHVVFSTDCEEFQDWQTLLLFHSAEQVKQSGPLTRIASGCSESKKIALTELYKKLHPQYHVHFTPDFKTDAKTNNRYDFYNKPYGVKHWLEYANPPIKEGQVIAVVDPDFIFLRPLTTKMGNQTNNIVTGRVKTNDIFDYVGRGKAVGQHYGLGAPWVNDQHKKFNRTTICGLASPCLKVPGEMEGGQYYSVGPPYILERNDFIRLTDTWTKFVPRVYEQYPFLLAEMYAYSMAAAHEELPHLRMDHFMVSNVDAGGEGWPWVDALGDDVCQPPVDGIYYPTKPLPTFFHYCQSYSAGVLSFWKRSISKSIFSCEEPLFTEPSNDLGIEKFMIDNDKVMLIIIACHIISKSILL